MTTKRESQLVRYSHGEPLVSYIKMRLCETQEGRKTGRTCERWEEEKIAGDGCRRRRNRIPQVHEVDEEGAVPTAEEEQAGNDVGGVSIGRSK